MIYLSDLYSLMSQWVERMENPIHASAYKIAVAECIFELNQLIDNQLKEESKQHEAA